MKEFHVTRTGHAIIQEVLSFKANTLEEAKNGWEEGSLDFEVVATPEDLDIDWQHTSSEEWEEA